MVLGLFGFSLKLFFMIFRFQSWLQWSLIGPHILFQWGMRAKLVGCLWPKLQWMAHFASPAGGHHSSKYVASDGKISDTRAYLFCTEARFNQGARRIAVGWRGSTSMTSRPFCCVYLWWFLACLKLVAGSKGWKWVQPKTLDPEWDNLTCQPHGWRFRSHRSAVCFDKFWQSQKLVCWFFKFP